jgi:hypothetical protein
LLYYALGCSFYHVAQSQAPRGENLALAALQKSAEAFRRVAACDDLPTCLTQQQRHSAQVTLAALEQAILQKDAAWPEARRRTLYEEYVAERENAVARLQYRGDEVAAAASALEQSALAGQVFAQAESIARVKVLKRHEVEPGQLQTIVQEGAEKGWATPASRFPEDLLKQHLEGMKAHYTHDPGFSAVRTHWDRLLDPNVLTFAILTIKSEGRLSLMDNCHRCQARRFDEMYVAVSTVPAARPEKARDYFPSGYVKFLDRLMDECCYGAGGVWLAHWTFCFEPGKHIVHLSVLPEWQLISGHKPATLVMAQDLMTAAEKAAAGLV